VLGARRPLLLGRRVVHRHLIEPPPDLACKIISRSGGGITYAAGLARAYNGDGFSDWYLPSQDELNKLYLSKATIGGFASGSYWSSSEDSANLAWSQTFGNGLLQLVGYKYGTLVVRAVRSF